ncbi:head decoration protein, partial [Pseudomonas sp. SIMBA_041]
PLGESTEERRASAVVRLAEVSEVHLTGFDADAEAALAAQFVIAR